MAILEQPLHLKGQFLEFSAGAVPDVAPSGMARVYYDKAANQVKFSANGGAYSGTPNSLSLADLTAHVLTTVPTASAAAAVLRLDTGTFAGNAAGTMLGINLHTGTSDLITAQKAGVNRFVVSETGIMTTLKGVIGGGTTSLGTVSVHQTDTDTIGLVVRAAVALPNQPWLVLENSAGSDLLVFGGSSPFLNLTAQGYGIAYNGQLSGGNHRFQVTADAATAIGFGIKIHASQSANVFETLTAAGSPGTTLFAIGPNGRDLVLDTTTGTKIGTVGGAAGQKLSFFNATPIVQPLLATGGGATADNIISTLQALGLCRQS